MARKKLTLSVEASVIERARLYSQTHRTTISRLVSRFLAELPAHLESDHSPTVQRLLGVLPASIDEGDYRKHIEEKHSV